MSTIQNQSAGGIWVKAVDRTPIKEGDLVAIRYGINYQFMGTAYFESGAWYEPNGNLLFKSPFNVIWLDESTSSPAEQQISQLRSLLSIKEGDDVVSKIEELLQAVKTQTRLIENLISGKSVRNLDEAISYYKKLVSPHQTNKEGEAK